MSVTSNKVKMVHDNIRLSKMYNKVENHYEELAKCETLQDLYKSCLELHYKLNDHHPEHFKIDDKLPEIETMPENARIELTCDLLASVLGVFKKKGVSVSLSECRFIIEHPKEWKHWKYAIKNFLPLASNIAPDFVERWKKFPDKEKEKLKELFEQFKKGACSEGIYNEMIKLDSVQYYLNDLKFHQTSIYEIWKQIPEFNVTGLEFKIKQHDSDKYDPIMILGYTANWCFQEKLCNEEEFKFPLHFNVVIMLFPGENQTQTEREGECPGPSVEVTKTTGT